MFNSKNDKNDPSAAKRSEAEGESFLYSSACGGFAEDFGNSSEVLSFSAIADVSELTEVHAESYGDKMVRTFSPENGARRLSEFVNLPVNVVYYLLSAVYLAVGIVCVAFPVAITGVLPYVAGGMMIFVGLVRFVLAIVRKEYRRTETNRTATSLILIALGVMIIVQHFGDNDAAITFIAIVWGIFGLFEGAYAFNRAFKRIACAERAAMYVLKGIVEVAVAFLLLYDPASHDAHYLHIIVFGCNLIIDAVTMLPFMDRLFNR